MNYANVVNQKMSSVNAPMPRSADSVKNNGGGYGFVVNPMSRVRRFLILGTEGGSYYESAVTLTVENTKNIVSLIQSGKGSDVLLEAVNVSDEGLARKNEPAIFVLALVLTYGTNADKQLAIDLVTKIVRTGTHLFILASYIKNLRGWGTVVKKVFTSWYASKSTSSLAYQITKYKNRVTEEGKVSSSWSHRDLLRMNHIKSEDAVVNNIFKFITKPEDFDVSIFKDTEANIIYGQYMASTITDKKEVIKLISEFKLSREMINTVFLSDKDVQAELINFMGLTALLRSLGSFSSSGLIDDYNPKIVNMICDKFIDKDELKKARLHPIQILEAIKTYANGKGFKGSLTWKVNKKVLTALNTAFYLCFDNIEPTGKTIYLGMDVSGSTHQEITGSKVLMVNEVIAVYAMVLARVEKNYILKAFSDRIVDVTISPSDSFESVVSRLSRISFGSTDCSAPMLDAIAHKADVDAFVILTDNETNYGVHPAQAIKQYRKEMNKPNCKMVVCAMSPCSFTIADTTDIDTIDIVGGSTDTISVISDFVAGKI